MNWRRASIQLIPELMTAAVAFFLPYWLGTDRVATASLAFVAIVISLKARTAHPALYLAWRLPRVDALNLRIESKNLPWRTLLVADSTLELLEDAQKRYKNFFPHSKAAIRAALERALLANDAASIHPLLVDTRRRIRRCLPASAPSLPSLDGLEELNEQSAALGEALSRGVS